MSANALVIELHVLGTRIGAIVNEKLSITVDTALRLYRYFGGDVQSWMNLQQAFDLKTGQAELKEELNHIIPMAIMA
jgi:addiction module HigA family antidote